MSRATSVTLRQVRPADLDTLHAQQVDAEACRMARFNSRPHGAFIEHWTRILDDDRVFKRAIVADGELAGQVVCFERSAIQQIGYWLGREFWGRGVASRAVALALPQIGRRPLYAFVAPHNVASQRVLEKCGFRRTDEPLTDPGGPGNAAEDLLFRIDGASSPDGA